MKYICVNCNYGFESEKENPLECPHCGTARFEKDKSAGELLEEVERVLEE